MQFEVSRILLDELVSNIGDFFLEVVENQTAHFVLGLDALSLELLDVVRVQLVKLVFEQILDVPLAVEEVGAEEFVCVVGFVLLGNEPIKILFVAGLHAHVDQLDGLAVVGLDDVQHFLVDLSVAVSQKLQQDGVTKDHLVHLLHFAGGRDELALFSLPLVGLLVLLFSYHTLHLFFFFRNQQFPLQPQFFFLLGV